VSGKSTIAGGASRDTTNKLKRKKTIGGPTTSTVLGGIQKRGQYLNDSAGSGT